MRLFTLAWVTAGSAACSFKEDDHESRPGQSSLLGWTWSCLARLRAS
jgi:hypothetical protein